MTAPRTSVFTSVRYARRRRRRGRTVVRILGIVLVSLLVLAVLSTVALWVYTARSIEGTEVAGLAGDPTEPTNVLLVTTTGAAPDRTADGISILQTGTARDTPVQLTLPLALQVTVPGGDVARLGDTFASGGAELLVRTVQDYTGVALDHYVEVPLAAAAQAVEVFGDVEVCSPTEGCRELDAAGVNALVRGDGGALTGVELAATQQAVIRAIADDASRLGTLIRPLKAKRLVDAASTVTTDVDLGGRGVLSLSRRLAAADPAVTERRIVPGYVSDDTGAVQAEVEPAEALFQSLRDVTPLPPDTGLEAPRTLSPDDVTVLVLNGVGTEGLAGEMATFLEQKGFVVSGAENAEEFAPDARTVVEHLPGARTRAELVQSYLPGVELVERDALVAGAEIAVTVGGDWARQGGGR